MSSLYLFATTSDSISSKLANSAIVPFREAQQGARQQYTVEVHTLSTCSLYNMYYKGSIHIENQLNYSGNGGLTMKAIIHEAVTK